MRSSGWACELSAAERRDSSIPVAPWRLAGATGKLMHSGARVHPISCRGTRLVSEGNDAFMPCIDACRALRGTPRSHIACVPCKYVRVLCRKSAKYLSIWNIIRHPNYTARCASEKTSCTRPPIAQASKRTSPAPAAASALTWPHAGLARAPTRAMPALTRSPKKWTTPPRRSSAA